jgi:prophage maintenance system killer protein
MKPAATHKVREKTGTWESGNRKGDIVLYQEPDGRTTFEVRLEEDTVWLSLIQIADLFQRDKSVVSRHLHNIFKTKELNEKSTVAFFATVQKEGDRTISRDIEYFNLDAIISVGYRVNSKRGTQFRIWATQVLRDHILKGYTANKKRLAELRQSLQLIDHVLDKPDVTSDEAKAVLRVVMDYAYALEILDDYDHQRVPVPKQIRKEPALGIAYEEAKRIIDRLAEAYGASDVFGLEQDRSLSSSLETVMQTFDDKDLYPGLEEKAAHLLYFLVKNHSFVDGNKRIGAALFLWFMEKNGLLYRPDGSKRIADNALVAMTLMIAESRPKEKDVMVNLIIHLINGKN